MNKRESILESLQSKRSVSDSVYKKIEKFERSLRNSSKEILVIFDTDGSVLYKSDGNYHGVEGSHDSKQIGKNKIITHTHPKDVIFSNSDFQEINTYDAIEMRVVTPNYIYSVKRPSGGWAKALQIFVVDYDRIRSELFLNAIKKGEEPSWYNNWKDNHFENEALVRAFGDLVTIKRF